MTPAGTQGPSNTRAVHINGRWSRSRAIFMRPSEATAPQWNRPPLRSASQPRKSSTSVAGWQLRLSSRQHLARVRPQHAHGQSPPQHQDSHFVSGDKVSSTGAGYIYGRYQRVGDLTWMKASSRFCGLRRYRSPFLAPAEISVAPWRSQRLLPAQAMIQLIGMQTQSEAEPYLWRITFSNAIRSTDKAGS